MYQLLDQLKIKKGSDRLLTPNFNSWMLIILVILENIILNIIILTKKKKISHAMLIINKKYLFVDYQKMINISEIKKMSILNSAKIYVKFINNYSRTKCISRKKMFTNKFSYTYLKYIFSKKINVFEYQNCPINISIVLKFRAFFNKQKFAHTFGKKGFSYSKPDESSYHFSGKIKYSLENYYNFDLPEFPQIQGWFDSTGRRIISFSLILNQIIHLFKKTSSIMDKLVINFQLFLYEILYFYINIRTGKSDICDCCNFSNNTKLRPNNLVNYSFLKWKILDEIDHFERKYSKKIKFKILSGHSNFSVDQAVQTTINCFKLIKRVNLFNYCGGNPELGCPKKPIENFYIYIYLFREYLFDIWDKNFLDKNILIFKKKERKRKNFFFKSRCIFDITMYKECCSNLKCNLLEFNLFVLIWMFYKNFNFRLITLQILSIAFQQSNFSLLGESILKMHFITQNFDRSPIKWKKNIKDSLKIINFKSLYFISTKDIREELYKIGMKKSQYKKYNFFWFFMIKNISFEKLKWFQTIRIFDNILLAKEYFSEKIRIIFENIKKKNSIQKDKIYSFKDNLSCVIHSLIDRKNKKGYFFTISLINSNSTFASKQIKIKCSSKFISSFILLVCVKFRISFLFFLFENQSNKNLMILLKKQVGDSIRAFSKNMLKLISCISISDNNIFFKLSSSSKSSNFMGKRIIVTIIQIFNLGPTVYLWAFKNCLKLNKIVEINPEFSFMSRLKEIFFYCIKMARYKQNSASNCFFSSKKSMISDRYECNMGPRKIFYISPERASRKKKKIETSYLNKIKILPKLDYSTGLNSIGFQKILNLLFEIRIIDFGYYKIFKKYLLHQSFMKWAYYLIHNILVFHFEFNGFSIHQNNSLKNSDTERITFLHITIFLMSLKKLIAFDFIPKIIFLRTNKKISCSSDKIVLAKFKNQDKKFLKLNTSKNIEFLENFKKSRSNVIYGTLASGFDFLIEKNQIFNYWHRFKHLIFKKLNFLPARILSVFSKTYQIKYSCLIDDKRFLFFGQQFDELSNYSITETRPFEELNEKLVFEYCNTVNINDFIKGKKIKDCIVSLDYKNNYKIAFVLDEKLNRFFSFKIQIFFDKKYSKNIYQWRKKVFMSSEQLFLKLLKPFRLQFFEIIKHPDFVDCGSTIFKTMINSNKIKHKLHWDFLFTFVDDHFLTFDFVFKNKIGIKAFGTFFYASGVYFSGNKKFESIDALKNKFIERIDIN